MAAIVGGGRGAKPGEISLAHNGVLFLDEFPEFPRTVLDTLRQPIEAGTVMVARANAHIRYPCRFLLIAAANPCKCGYLSDPNRACGRAPICGEDYLGRISGPLMDRFDLRVEVPPVAFADLDLQIGGKLDRRGAVAAAAPAGGRLQPRAARSMPMPRALLRGAAPRCRSRALRPRVATSAFRRAAITGCCGGAPLPI
jgi:magnesium chelatase family protein